MGNCESEDMLLGTAIPVLGKLGPVSDLKMVRLTWEKDYQGLFDYDSKEVVKKTFTIDRSSLVMGGGQSATVLQLSSPRHSKETVQNACFGVVRRPNFYKITPSSYQSGEYTLQRRLWLIVKTIPQRRYALKQKDVVKLGKQSIRIREIVHGDVFSNPSENHQPILTAKKIYEDLRYKAQGEPAALSKEDNNLNEVQSVLTQNEPACRVCLEGGQLTNPLICPCKCTGSVRHIHLTCLRTWLGKRLNILKSKYCISIKWIPLTCEMCKATYKYRIYMDNKKYYTVDIPKPAKPYIVMEILSKNSDKQKVFHFVSCSSISKLSLGRKKDIDVKISDDISLSRHHANLIYNFQDRQFLLEDNKSKFGTLLQIKKNLLINPHQRGLGFQVNGEVFLFETHRTEGAIPQYKDYEQFLNYNQGKEKEQEQDSEDVDGLGEEEAEDDRDPNRQNRAEIYNISEHRPPQEASVSAIMAEQSAALEVVPSSPPPREEAHRPSELEVIQNRRQEVVQQPAVAEPQTAARGQNGLIIQNFE